MQKATSLRYKRATRRDDDSEAEDHVEYLPTRKRLRGDLAERPSANIRPCTAYYNTTGSGELIILERASLWQQFSAVGNEMIVTKSGRCLFPVLSFRAVNLIPSHTYSVAIQLVQTVSNRFKFSGGQWKPVPLESDGTKRRIINEPCGPLAFAGTPKSGLYWMNQGATFGKIKATNRKQAKLPPDHFYLTSSREYAPRIYLMNHTINSTTRFTYDETKFIAVTHYQNEKCNLLKKGWSSDSMIEPAMLLISSFHALQAYNPHARAHKRGDHRAAAQRLGLLNSSATSHTGLPTETVIDTGMPFTRACRDRTSSQRTRHSAFNETSLTTSKDFLGRGRNSPKPSALHCASDVLTPPGSSYGSTYDSDGSDACSVYDEWQSCESEGHSRRLPGAVPDNNLMSHNDETDSDWESDLEAARSLGSSNQSTASYKSYDGTALSNERPSALQVLAMFCSHILETNTVESSPLQWASPPLLPPPQFIPPVEYDFDCTRFLALTAERSLYRDASTSSLTDPMNYAITGRRAHQP
ncbi:hypothetical protein BC832DRAFT_608632 [Gaertneriomyces semiglobifer]|nr:hypothetical protein BC832DRAFT_608632 [Gaertneriomyces semiglobifer]